MQFSCNNGGNCGSSEKNLSSTFAVGVNYTKLQSNGINEPTEEKHVSAGTDERKGWICW